MEADTAPSGLPPDSTSPAALIDLLAALLPILHHTAAVRALDGGGWDFRLLRVVRKCAHFR